MSWGVRVIHFSVIHAANIKGLRWLPSFVNSWIYEMAISTHGLFLSSFSIWWNVNTLYVLIYWPSMSSNTSILMNIACRPRRSFAWLRVNGIEGYMSLMLVQINHQSSLNGIEKNGSRQVKWISLIRKGWCVKVPREIVCSRCRWVEGSDPRRSICDPLLNSSGFDKNVPWPEGDIFVERSKKGYSGVCH